MAAQYGSAVAAPALLTPRPEAEDARRGEAADALRGEAEARALIVAGALTPSSIGAVGLELEMHLVDVDRPDERVSWERLTSLVADLPPMPSGGAVTLEPGGQVELSPPPRPDVVAAVAALDDDHRALAAAFAAERLGLVAVGADPARPVQRMNPKARYVGMEEHFRATGSGGAGLAMMCSTAALQLNIEAGPIAKWPIRVSRIHRLGPVLVAISACSPWLAGATSGWRSMRQQTWEEIDRSRSGPLLDGAHPEDEWASYALAASVMLVRDPLMGGAEALTERVRFLDWVEGRASIARPPTIADLDYHLSTLFPPVRPRGFLEVRCLDAVPHRWWPGLAGLAVTLLDDPVAADVAADACSSIDGAWSAAARDGLSHPAIAKAARACVEVAVDRAPIGLAAAMAEYADLVLSGRTPGDEIRERAESQGPLALLAGLAAESISDA
jgi:ergothioneine biosynthesis glutamate--cysteine ligase EgtA